MRIASLEGSAALELRATQIFGPKRELLRQVSRRDTDEIAQLQYDPASRLRLNMEAAAFGAALFEAEEAAARRYELHYTTFGSRHEDALG